MDAREEDGCVGLELKGGLGWTMSLGVGLQEEGELQGCRRLRGKCTMGEKVEPWTGEGEPEKEGKTGKEGDLEAQRGENFQKDGVATDGHMHRDRGDEGIPRTWSLGTFATATLGEGAEAPLGRGQSPVWLRRQEGGGAGGGHRARKPLGWAFPRALRGGGCAG